jgi:hypothetical protein
MAPGGPGGRTFVIGRSDHDAEVPGLVATVLGSQDGRRPAQEKRFGSGIRVIVLEPST